MRQPILSWISILCLTLSMASAQAQTLVADYEFQATLSSSIPGAPDLSAVGPTAFAGELFGRDTRTVMQFEIGSGLMLTPTTDIIAGDSYSIVILFRFDDVTNYNKFIDFRNRGFDDGAYVLNGQYNFYPVETSPSSVVTPNIYVQMVLTRDSSNTVKGYADGIKVLEFTDSTNLAVIDANNTLFFFLDDSDTSFGEVSAGAVARIRIYNGALSESAVAALTQFGTDVTRGDISEDGRVTIQDVVILARMLVGLSTPPAQETDAFARADANANGVLEVGDIVRAVDIILNITGKPVAEGPASARIALDVPQMQPDGNQVIPIRLSSDGTIAGAQASLSFDEDRLAIGTPYLMDGTDDLSLSYHVVDGRLRLVVYSLTGRPIPADGAPLVYVPVNVRLSNPARLTLDEAVLADGFARNMRVFIEQRTVAVNGSGTAGDFSLEPASPNPFNPSTQISFNVPQQTHVRLTVYNLLGQEILRLVDQNKAPGRYTVTWHGRDARGSPVSSGVYIYQVTTGTGFHATRRVTLLK